MYFSFVNNAPDLHMGFAFGGFFNMAVYTKLIFAFSTYHLEQYVNGALTKLKYVSKSAIVCLKVDKLSFDFKQ